jgi:hypothetical protein
MRADKDAEIHEDGIESYGYLNMEMLRERA